MKRKKQTGPSRTFVVLAVVMGLIFIAGLVAVVALATAAPPP